MRVEGFGGRVKVYGRATPGQTKCDQYRPSQPWTLSCAMNSDGLPEDRRQKAPSREFGRQVTSEGRNDDLRNLAEKP